MRQFGSVLKRALPVIGAGLAGTLLGSPTFRKNLVHSVTDMVMRDEDFQREIVTSKIFEEQQDKLRKRVDKEQDKLKKAISDYKKSLRDK